MHPTRLALAAVALLLVTGPGCAATACSDVGGYDGVAVTVPPLALSGARVEVEVCVDDECGTTAPVLPPAPEGPVAREVVATAEALGLELAPGAVVVTATLVDGAGRAVASRRAEVVLTRSYPNGRTCDGDGHVVGSLVLDAGER